MQVKFSDSIPMPVSTVFKAVKYPTQMVNYFISASNGILEKGKTITWEFNNEPQPVEIIVTELIEDKQIQFQWNATGIITTVNILFEKTDSNNTKLIITEDKWEWKEENYKYAMQQIIGWTDFFCCLKAYLLFNVNLRTGDNSFAEN